MKDKYLTKIVVTKITEKRYSAKAFYHNSNKTIELIESTEYRAYVGLLEMINATMILPKDVKTISDFQKEYLF